MIPSMTLRSPVYKLLSIGVVLSITLAGRAQSLNKTVDDTYIYNPKSPQSYLDGIQYNPAWTHSSGDSQRFNGTYSSSTQPLTNLIHFFQGNAIHYYGETGGSDHAPVIVYFDGNLDGETVQTNTSASTQYQQLLWSKTGLGAGDHQIILTHGGQSDQVMGLDYFVVESDHGFTPSDTGPAASNIPREDNSDHFTYSGWEVQVLQSVMDDKLHYNNTMHRTKRPGTSATFRFTGTTVWYITNLHPDNGLVSVTLDGVSNRIVNTGSDRRLAQRIVWSELNLTYGDHTVVMTHQDRVKKSVTVDYFAYLPGSEPPQKSSSLTGAIVGGVVGGVALIAICVAGWILVRRRRATRLRPDVNSHGFNGPPQQFTVPPTWRYVTTPYVSGPNENYGALPAHDYEHRRRKGQPIRLTPPAPNAVASSGPTILSTEDMESYRDELESRDRETDINPPPYVRR